MEWTLVYAHHKDCCVKQYHTINELKNSGFERMNASVPGCLEIDLMKTGKLDELYFSTNTLKAQELEDAHVWYYTVLNITNANQYLCFEGIDTFADIYVNGKLVKSTDNMYLPYEVQADWLIGENEIVVHIKPTMLEMRKYKTPAACYAQNYNYPSLYVRKASHMFGWDIMPRIVSAGLWKDVSVKERKCDRIEEVYLATTHIENNTASMRFYINTELCGSFATEYMVRLEGRCGQSYFLQEKKLWHNTHAFTFDIENCKFWWPKHVGEANLYDVTVTLLYRDEVCDTYKFKTGIRTVKLLRTDSTDENGNGEFCFEVNSKKIFVLGTNWVALDALHANDINRLPKAMALLDDVGCNMVRCWGGNVYESDEFFQYCDAHGIMVWQDFAMGCAVYPDDRILSEKLEEEATYQIKRLRNHPSLVLWAGDNECDVAIEWANMSLNPNHNSLTRNFLRRMVEMHDYSRPYLPSSPFISKNVYRAKGIKPEEHMWGPRDYFKGPFYKDTFCHFASEIGYHGFPSPKSLSKFLKEPEKIFREEDIPTDEYLVHAASMEFDPKAPYAYRIKLAYDQVVTLFGKAEDAMDDFVRQSQISQAEAKKYFIEKFRIGKWTRTGVIWWNLLDGWPQVSDAIVDYYFTKKLAYHYIKRSQKPVCLMFDEPKDGSVCLVGVNDFPQKKEIHYHVRRGDKIFMEGTEVIPSDSAITLGNLEIEDGEKAFYLIEWEMDGETFKNHYYTNIIDINYQEYMSELKRYGMDEFEGFQEDWK